MGLLSTEVEVVLKNNLIKYYENLGYQIPRRKDKQGKYTVPRGTKLLVKVKDLSYGSNVNVDVQCDDCSKIINIKYANYVNCNRNGLYYCHNCASKLNSGKNHYKWDDNKTDEERINKRNYPEYIDFVKRVLARDNYTCQCCGQIHGDLNVHHLNSYNWFEAGRTDPNNGITLCEKCHINFHLQYGKGDNTKEQFEEWIGHTVQYLHIYNGELPVARKIYCIEEDKVYDGACELSKLWNVPHTTIYSICNHKIKKRIVVSKNGENCQRINRRCTVKGKHLLWYDEYLNMTKEDIEIYLKNSKNRTLKQVICLTTGKIFDSCRDGIKYYNCSNHVTDCCKGRRNSCGALDDGTPLQWMYYDDYINKLTINKELEENKNNKKNIEEVY